MAQDSSSSGFVLESGVEVCACVCESRRSLPGSSDHRRENEKKRMREDEIAEKKRDRLFFFESFERSLTPASTLLCCV